MFRNILPVILLAVLLAGCGGAPEKSAAPASQAPPVTVETQVVQPSEWLATLEAMGTVRAKTSAMIASKVMGYVREVRVQAGDTVAAGDLLVLLDARDLDAAHRTALAGLAEARDAMSEVENAIRAAEANLELARATHQRMSGLYEKSSVSRQEFDEVVNRLRMAEANHEMALSKRNQLQSKIRQAEEGVRSAEIMLGYAEIRAPFAGVVIEKAVQPGNLAAPGAPLLILERRGEYRLEVPVEESRLAVVKPGAAVTVQLDALDRRIAARVTDVVPTVDPAARTFLVKIDLPAAPDLRSGLFGRAVFAVGSRTVLTVPADAIVSRGQLQWVFVSDDGTARLRMITAGDEADGRREILSGLTAGETIIYPVAAGLADGAKVEVRS
jgi:RND family efflux transporter MFP subunit